MASLTKTFFLGLFGLYCYGTLLGAERHNVACPAPSIMAVGSTVDCRDGLVRLRISPFESSLYTYQWFKDGVVVSGQTFEDIFLTVPEESGDYTVLATDIFDPTCTSPESNAVNVQINELPDMSDVPTIVGANPGCAGDDVILSSTVLAPAGGLYRWFRNGVSLLGETNSSLVISETDESGNYTVEIVSAASCASGQSPSVGITIEPLPPPPSISTGLTGNQICADGTQITLTSELAPDGGTYAWYKDGVLLSENTQEISLTSSDETGEYTVEVTDGNGARCTSLRGPGEAIEIFELPTVASTGADFELCAEGSTTLNGNTPVVGTGSWTAATAGLVFSDVSDPNATVSGLTPGVYEFSWQIDNGLCKGVPAVQRIEVFAPPSPAVTEDDKLICDANSTLISAVEVTSGEGSWEIVSGDGDIANPADNTTQLFNLNVNSEVVLAWTVTNGNCIEERDELRIELSSSPSAAEVPTGNQQLCSASQTTLEAVTPSIGSGVWSIISGTATIENAAQSTVQLTGLTPGENVTARWTVSNVCGINQTDILIENEMQPDLADAGADQDVCGATSTVLTGSGNGGTWTVVSGAALFDDENDPNTSVSGLAIGENVLRYSITAAICDDSDDDVVIAVFEEPSPAVIITPNATFCNGETALSVSAQPPAVGIGSWEIIAGDGNIAENSSSAADISGLSPGETLLRWTVTNGNCNTNSADLNVFIYPTPAVQNSSIEICAGESIQLNAVGGDRYLWSPSFGLNANNIANPIVSPAETTTYTVSIERDGCPSDNLEVLVRVNPNPELFVSPDTTIFANQKITLFASGADEYFWLPTESLDDPNSSSPIASPVQTTVYTVMGTNQFGCSAQASVTVAIDSNFEIFVPDLFSPNGDNVNDFLVANALGARIKEFRIFDRKGHQLFVSRDENDGWDGRLNGSDQSMDTYIYYVVAELPNGERITQKGSVQLIR